MTPDAEITLITDVAVIKTQLADLVKLIKGNGKKGIDDRLKDQENLLETHLQKHCEEEKEQREKEEGTASLEKEKRDNNWKVKLLVIGGSITLITNLVLNLVSFFMK
jgi:hypothetical protein